MTAAPQQQATAAKIHKRDQQLMEALREIREAKKKKWWKMWKLEARHVLPQKSAKNPLIKRIHLCHSKQQQLRSNKIN